MITGEEFGNERRKLISEGKRELDPELAAPLSRLRNRDDELWTRYGRPLIHVHPGKWALISLDGEVTIHDTGSQAIADGTRRYGGGNFAYGKLAEFRGRNLARW